MIGLSLLLLLSAETGALESTKDAPSPAVIVEPEPRKLGDGFQKHSYSLEVKLTRALGTTETGSVRSHNLWLTQIQAGLMLTDVLAEKHWWGGNVEGTGLLIAGGQDHPDAAYFVGLDAGVRYHFRTGTAIDPFIGGAVGVAGTDAGLPDLGGKFQFNEQIGAGARYLLSAHHAITLEYAYWHVSNAGIREPNDGINAHLISLGFAWLF